MPARIAVAGARRGAVCLQHLLATPCPYAAVVLRLRFKAVAPRCHPQDNRDTLWDKATALAIAVGGSSEDLRYLKSIALQLWLFGYEIPGAHPCGACELNPLNGAARCCDAVMFSPVATKAAAASVWGCECKLISSRASARPEQLQSAFCIALLTRDRTAADLRDATASK